MEKNLGLCEIVFFQRMSHWSAGYKLLIEISEWHALYGMFSKKLSVSRNESAEISRKISIIYRRNVFWVHVSVLRTEKKDEPEEETS